MGPSKKNELPGYLENLVRETSERGLAQWALDELKTFHGKMALVSVDVQRSYSPSFENLRKVWYDHLHDKLQEYGFVNGQPLENTWEKRPKAHFWWDVYATEPAHYRPFYDHHCSSKDRLEQILNMLDDLIEALKGEVK